jgi:hypothetical protein
MQLSNQFATVGLVATATPQSKGTFNDNVIGHQAERISLAHATGAYFIQAVLIGENSKFYWNTDTLSTSGSTSPTAGTAQVETATAAGTASASGNVSVTVTGAGMTGSPLTISVPVVNGDTAAVWAAKVRTALSANATIASRYTVGGSTTAISLTRKPFDIFGVDYIFPNDVTLNIAIANGSPSPGITAAATSANTTAGVETAGAFLFGADGEDIYGDALPLAPLIAGTLIKTYGGLITLKDDDAGPILKTIRGGTTIMEVITDPDTEERAYIFNSLDPYTAIDLVVLTA